VPDVDSARWSRPLTPRRGRRDRCAGRPGWPVDGVELRPGDPPLVAGVDTAARLARVAWGTALRAARLAIAVQDR
jgi:hypothetical protein